MILENPLDRDLFFYSDVAQDSIGELTQAIVYINRHDEKLANISRAYGFTYTPDPIKLYVNSFGGDVYACLGLISIMKTSKTPIHTIVTGCAMSAGFMIAISGHKRFCYNNSSYMWHQVSSLNYGKIQEKEENMIEDRRLQVILDQHILDLTGITTKKLQKMYKSKQDKFFNPEKALELNLVDSII
jgi:ATP-dependent Clp protease, protease subunit